MRKLILITTIFLSINSFADTELAHRSYRPMVDDAKCVAAMAWTLPTMAGLALGQMTATLSDISSSIADGKVCLSASKFMIKKHVPVLKSLIEMGCIAPYDDIQNPKYYTQLDELKTNPSVKLFRCDE
ncbi:hypothetical protein M899_1656 [Bacteriovorax sp. BSW11_IV]|uniref:hypothetical protein n=1 Tax=Bacteriovorax sp. BSW11_IV TaxID=1353529 RepID=UPI00038A4F4D|nr:hypothetical protein [Bacteriovorax sp. BSW11_IV]EQC49375.1 hypothetical protein M899_1656 [Bacteriovorax sp. BSW11_IV]